MYATLFLDEPEAFIASSKMPGISEWLQDMAARSSGVVLTTHSCELLALQGFDNPVVVIERNGVKMSASSSQLAPNLGPILKRIMDCDRLSLFRKFLFVEGEHEFVILKALLGEQLDRSGVWIVPTDGEIRSTNVYKAQLLKPYFENVKDGSQYLFLMDSPFPNGASEPRSLDSEGIVQLLKKAFKSSNRERSTLGRNRHFVSLRRHPECDVWLLLPESVINEVLLSKIPKKDRFESWGKALEDFRGSTEAVKNVIGFKDFCRTRYGLNMKTKQLELVLQSMKSRSEYGNINDLLRIVEDFCNDSNWDTVTFET
jgi:hypothetical protein